MKHSLALLFMAPVIALFCGANSQADVPGLHGMLLFGTQETFASHLPMFHPPHDYQLLMKLSLNGAGAAAYEKAKATSSDYFTLVPEVMDLTQIIRGAKTSFSAVIYQGHFERRGKPLGSVQVRVDKILYAAKLNGDAVTFKSEYLVFGDASESFAAHLIEGSPTFDAIVSVASPPSPRVQPVILKGPPGLPLAGDRLGDMSSTSIQIKKVIYTEEGDLEL